MSIAVRSFKAAARRVELGLAFRYAGLEGCPMFGLSSPQFTPDDTSGRDWLTRQVVNRQADRPAYYLSPDGDRRIGANHPAYVITHKGRIMYVRWGDGTAEAQYLPGDPGGERTRDLLFTAITVAAIHDARPA